MGELIVLLGDAVLSRILAGLKRAKFYSISVDSTPDAKHFDQLTLIIRYVLPDHGPVERFLTFLDLERHTDEHAACNLPALLPCRERCVH